VPGLYGQYKIYDPGDILTAADLNATDYQHIKFQTPQATDDYSNTLTESRAQESSATLATSLAGELARLRKKIALLGGKTYWDQVTGTPAAQIQVMARVARTVGSFNLGAFSFAVTCDQVLFNGGTRRNVVSGTLNINNAGPNVPNARDQAANFVNIWVHIFWIWDDDNGVAALIASSTHSPFAGPVLFGTYSEWAYITTLWVGATANRWGYGGIVRHSRVWIAPVAVGTLDQIVQTAFSSLLSTYASNGIYMLDTYITADAGGIADSTLILYHATSMEYATLRARAEGLTPSTPYYPGTQQITLSNYNVSVYYKITNTNGVGTYPIKLIGYQVPNGDT
jgi:hypothetical protein